MAAKLIGTDSNPTTNSGLGYIRYTDFTCEQTGVLTSLRVYCLVNGNVRAAIYTSVGSYAVTLLAETGSEALVAGAYRDMALTTSVNLTAGTHYCLAVQSDTTGGNGYLESAGYKHSHELSAYGAFPATATNTASDAYIEGVQGWGNINGFFQFI